MTLNLVTMLVCSLISFSIIYLISLCVILSFEHKKILYFVNHDAVEVIEEFKEQNHIRNGFINLFILLVFILTLPINYLNVIRHREEM